MSDQTNVPTIPTKAKRTRSASIEHSAAILAFAKAKDTDPVKAGKMFRARLRANPDVYTKNGGKAHAKNTAWAAHPRKALAAIFPDVQSFKG